MRHRLLAKTAPDTVRGRVDLIAGLRGVTRQPNRESYEALVA